MADFDPYFQWLNIPPTEQPADHYRLLGVPRFASDPDAIAKAIDRQMTHVQTFHAGPHSEASQRLLNEFMAARLCLLNEQAKADYDTQLADSLLANQPLPLSTGEAAPNKPTDDPILDPRQVPANLDTAVQPASSVGFRADRGQASWLTGLLKLIGIGLGVAGGIALILFLLKVGPDKDPLTQWEAKSVDVSDAPMVSTETPPSKASEQKRVAVPEERATPASAFPPADRQTRPQRPEPENKKQTAARVPRRDLASAVAANPQPTPPADEPEPVPPSQPEPSQDTARSSVGRHAPLPAIAPFDGPQAQQHQRDWANHLKCAVDVTNTIGMKLSLIPPGEFVMGSPKSEAGREHGETQHLVKIPRPFRLSRFEVTQQQYESVRGAAPSHFKGAYNPVEGVSWRDAVEFCRRLSARREEIAAGRVYRLPTEAEWEYACRAGTTTAYSFGNQENDLVSYGWFKGNANGTTHPVGQGKPNAFGLYDLHGNVWEWCQDRYGTYPSGPASDEAGPRSGSYRVRRGGSWINGTGRLRSAYRRNFAPDVCNFELGFRVALSVPVVGGK